MTTIVVSPPISVSAANTLQVLFVLRSANVQLTTDQVFTKLFTGTKYRITEIIAAQKTGGATVACAGGVYDTASKAGNAIIAAGQSWVTLAASVNVVGTLAAVNNTALLTATPFLSLSTGSTAACTADFFIVGYVID
jgi:hypothetical protein